MSQMFGTVELGGKVYDLSNREHLTFVVSHYNFWMRETEASWCVHNPEAGVGGEITYTFTLPYNIFTSFGTGIEGERLVIVSNPNALDSFISMVRILAHFKVHFSHDHVNSLDVKKEPTFENGYFENKITIQVKHEICARYVDHSLPTADGWTTSEESGESGESGGEEEEGP